MRTGAFALGWIWSLTAVAAGQDRPFLRVDLGSAEPPVAYVTIVNLLADDRFLGAMESGFPLYLEHRAELRESRALWDRTVDREEWEYVVLYDPVRDRYVIEDADGTEILPDRDRLRDRVGRVYEVALRPDGRGTFHYRVHVSARTLSDKDVDEVFAWLKGENLDSLPVRRPGVITRTARRLLIQLAPLPSLQLEARSSDFRR